jgi:hypothetical protein
LSEDAPPVNTLNPAVPVAVSRVVTKLLARVPADRYASASEVHKAVTQTNAAPATERVPLSARYTPRSAPTISFLQATSAKTEVTIVPPSRPPSRVVRGAVAVAAIAAAGFAIYSFRARDQEQVTSAPDVRILDSVRSGAPPAAAAPVESSHAPPVVADSSALLARRIEQRAKDSVARSEAQRAAAVRAPIAKYAHAIESANIATLHAVYPQMSQQQQQNWEKNVFARAEHMKTAVQYGASRVTGDSATVSFSLVLSYTDKETKQPLNSRLRQDAKLVRRAAGWEIVSVK